MIGIENDNSINWHNVASDVGTRNNKECRKRWVYALSAPSVKGPWDSREDRLLIEAVEKHGFKYVSWSHSRSPPALLPCWPRYSSLLPYNVLDVNYD